MIKSSNYEINRCRSRGLTIESTDIIVYGVLAFYFAPMKRKIDSKTIFNEKQTGRSEYNYDEASNIFYLDNKFKVVNSIANRAVVITELMLQHNDGRMLRIRNINSKILNLGTIVDKFLDFCGGNLPKNIFTNDPIICELFHFFLANFFKPLRSLRRQQQQQRRWFDEKVILHFIKNIQFNNYENGFSVLKKMKCYFKTRTVVITNNNNNNNNNSSSNSNVIKEKNNKKYLFQDQCIVIRDYSSYPSNTKNDDDNVFPNLKIYINISEKFVTNKSYFSNKPNDNKNFVCETFCNNICNGINKYFQ